MYENIYYSNHLKINSYFNEESVISEYYYAIANKETTM